MPATIAPVPANGRGTFCVFRLTGRSGTEQFRRVELVNVRVGSGRPTVTQLTDPGLYEVRDSYAKRPVYRYLLLARPDRDGLMDFEVDREDALVVAGELDRGRPFGSVVACGRADPTAVSLAAERDYVSHLKRTPGVGRIRLEYDVPPFRAGDDVLPSALCRVLDRALVDVTDRLEAAAAAGAHPDDWWEASAPTAGPVEKGRPAADAEAACWEAIARLTPVAAKRVVTSLRLRLGALTRTAQVLHYRNVQRPEPVQVGGHVGV